MGKTKTKIIDDSQLAAEKPKKKGRAKDELVEKLKAELADVGKEKLDVGSEKNVQPPKPTSKIQHPSSKKIRSKKYQEATKDLDKSKTYPVAEAIELTKIVSFSKFTGTLEAHINTVQAGLRGLVSLPFASGKKLRMLVFTSSASSGIKPENGITLGNDSIIEDINKGKVNYDLVITTPEWMPKLAKAARILGPKGLMPNPKNNTITDDPKKAVALFQAGKTEYKTESKAAVIHLGLGKLSQPTEELSANINTLVQTLGKSKIKKFCLSPTMGPSIKLDLASL